MGPHCLGDLVPSGLPGRPRKDQGGARHRTGEIRLRVASMRVELWVSSLEPAVGGSMTPGTRQAACDRSATASVKLHGSCTREDGLDTTRPSPGSAAIGLGGGVWAGHGAVPSPVEGPMLVTSTRTSRCPVSYAAGSHAGSHADERPSSSPDSREQRAAARPRSRTHLNGSGCPYGYLRIRRLYTGFPADSKVL
jgi:hypothetical protein